MKQFPQQEQTKDDTGGEVRRHYQSPAVAVWIPAVQATLTGIFLGVAMGVAAAALSWPRPWAWGLGVFAIVQAATWLLLLSGWRSLVWSLERALGVDLDRDHQVGDPQRVRIELTQPNEGGHVTQIAELDVDPAKMGDLSRGLLAGASFSEAQWSGAGALFSRSQFRKVRDEFLKRGWLEWVNPEARAQGLQLTRSGTAVIRYFAQVEKPPTLKARTRERV
jgi:hypothetical protein